MPRSSVSSRTLALGALALVSLALGACETSHMLVAHLTAHPAPAKPVTANPRPLAEDLALVHQSLAAPPDAQTQLLAHTEATYQIERTARATLRLALLLAIPPKGSESDLARAQRLLTELTSDPKPALTDGELALARLELKLIGDGLTLAQENRTLQNASAQQLAGMSRVLQTATAQNVALRRELDQARAKLAAIANIEKSLNEGKLGNQGPPK